MLKDLVQKNRSYRRFNPERKISQNELLQLVDMARLTASSKNRQPLKYKLVNESEDVDFVFDQLSWAWYLKDWKGPSKSERPSAYIMVFLDKDLNDNAFIDVGIACQTILLGATEMGLGGIIMRTVNRFRMKKKFQYADNLDLVLVIALGEPKQEIKIVKVSDNGNIEYYEDENNTHYVPKRNLKDIILD